MLWKSGETVFSTKTAACMQCCLHTPVHTSVGILGDILTAGQVHIQLVCVRSSLAEVKSVQLDECNAEVCQFRRRRTLSQSAVCSSQWSVLMCAVPSEWKSVLMCASLAGVGGHTVSEESTRAHGV